MWLPAYVTNDKSVAYNYALSGNKIVIIDEDDKDFAGVPNTMNASILLPPYEAVARELDNDYDGAKYLYETWLCKKECMEYIELIVFALMKGIPITLYFGPDSNEMRFPTNLLEFFFKMAGVCFANVNNPNTSGYMTKAYIPINLGNMLLNGVIDIPTFYEMMPDDADLIPDAISYLASTLRPLMNPGSTLRDYNEYFKNLIKLSRKHGKYLHNPILGVGSKV